MKITLAVTMLLAALGGCTTSGAGGLLSAAGGPASGVVGDPRGGRIPNGMADVPASMRAATDHCARYGKKAQITQMEAPSKGGLIGFECH